MTGRGLKLLTICFGSALQDSTTIYDAILATGSSLLLNKVSQKPILLDFDLSTGKNRGLLAVTELVFFNRGVVEQLDLG